MLETVKSRSRTVDNELLFLKRYKCRSCGHFNEFLQNLGAELKSGVRCDHCGSIHLEALGNDIQNDFYW